MVQLHIVSSSHSYHNCKIPFLYEHLMTPFMTRRRRRLLIPIIHLITRIYHAYCLLHQSSSPSIRIPYQSRSSRARVTVARPRSPVFLRPLLQSKSFYIVKLLYSRQWALFACTLYHVRSDCRFCLSCTNTSYVTLGFFILFTSMAWTSFYFLPFSYVKRLLVAFSGNNASLHFGVGVLFHSGLICVIN